jgi:nucleoid DNA-binding protein
MTKTEFTNNVAQKLNISKADASRFADAYAEVAVEALRTGDDVTLPGLVKLVVRDKPARPERQGVNPLTKQQITIKAKPASKRVGARPIAALKKAVI